MARPQRAYAKVLWGCNPSPLNATLGDVSKLL